MGKKGARRKAREERSPPPEAEESYAPSVASRDTTDTWDLAGMDEQSAVDPWSDHMGDGQDRPDTHLDALPMLIDELTEKRSKARVDALGSLADELRNRREGQEDTLGNYHEQLQNAVMQCLRRGGSEGRRAADLLAILFVSLQDEAGSYWARAASKLQLVAQSRVGASSGGSGGSDSSARASAVRALALGCFLVSEDAEETDRIIAVLTSLITGGDATTAVRTAAVESWALLLTMLDLTTRLEVAGEVLPALATLLAGGGNSADDTQLRLVVGECVALLHESRTDRAEEAETTGEPLMPTAGDNAVFWEMIREALHAKATESNKRMSKQAKKEQHSAFRSFLGALDDNDAPSSSVTFATGHVSVTTWTTDRRMAALRQCLKGGLPSHLATNALLSQVFGEDFEYTGEGAVAQVHSKRSAVSRARSHKRETDRRNRQSAKDHFLSDF